MVLVTQAIVAVVAAAEDAAAAVAAAAAAVEAVRKLFAAEVGCVEGCVAQQPPPHIALAVAHLVVGVRRTSSSLSNLLHSIQVNFHRITFSRQITKLIKAL